MGVFTLLVMVFARTLVGNMEGGENLIAILIGLFFGPIVFLIYSKIANYRAELYNKRGLNLMRARQYEKAAQQFRASLDYYDNHAWLDEYRHYVIMSSSARSYREKALYNLALAYHQQGQPGEAETYCRRLMEDYSLSDLVKSCEVILENLAEKANPYEKSRA